MTLLDLVARDVPAFGVAVRHHQAGDMVKARAAYLDLMDEPALTAICLNQLGLIAAARADFTRAAELFQRAIRLDPALALAYHNLGTVLDRLGHPAAAMATLTDLGCALQASGRTAEAIPLYRQVLARDPLTYAVHVNLGTALARLDQLGPAADHLLAAITLYGRLFPEIAAFARDLRARLGGLGAGVELPPGMPRGPIARIEDALTTLGKVLGESERPDQALRCFAKSVALAPGYAPGHWNLALALLGQGDFAAGWDEFEWRWRWPDFSEPRRLLPVLPWRGETLAGKRILVWAEQGDGDILQFVPLVRRLAAQGARVLLEVPGPLVRLLRHNLGDVTVAGKPDAPHLPPADPRLDYMIPLMSLPARLGLRSDELPLARGYLRPLPTDQADWEARLASAPGRRVGIVWAGGDDPRSVPFETLRPLFEPAGLSWHSLQTGPAQRQLAEAALPQVRDLSPQLADVADTAAAIAGLDLVISVCTASAHLAAAMGKPTWLLTRTPPDWRWAPAGATSPWYPAMRLFRQGRPGDWAGVVAEVGQALATGPAAALRF